MIIDYSMVRGYRSHWSEYDAIREMVQNSFDAGGGPCSVDKGYVEISNEGVIPLETLMLGESQKSSDSVGRYGEGYKIGMLILTRENMEPKIISGNHSFTGLFDVNDMGVETFRIKVEELDSHHRGTVFSCNLGNVDIKELQRRLPAFDKPLDMPSQVEVLVDRPGEIYVNGLWVCTSKLTHGYNFHPDYIELNTDRNMVNGVYWQLGKFYGSCGEKMAEHIFNLIEADAGDVSNISYHLHNNKLKAELARLFFNKYGDGAKIAKPGTTYIGGSSYVSTSSNAGRVYANCGIQEAKKTVDPEAPHALLEAFLEGHKSRLRRDVKADLGRLIERSKGWSKPASF